MQPSMHLFLESKTSEGIVERRCRMERRDGERITSSEVLWYALPASTALPSEGDGEPYLLAYLMQAMREGRSLVVHGEVSRVLLSNLMEFRDAWCCWKPRHYAPIDFEADAILDPSPILPKNAAIAFSGGVDSVFSLWRYFRKHDGHRSYRITRPVLVHGFDIPLSDDASFAAAQGHAESALSDIDLSPLVIRTNFRDVMTVSWEDACAIAIASAMQFCKGECGQAIIGSSEPYHSLVIPWGSNPVTDHLLTSGTMEVVHDGAAFGRVDKVLTLSEWQAGRDHLRVCWEGNHHGENCGRCEKCQRTLFNFLCNNLPIPACLPQQIDTKLLKRTRISSAIMHSEWSQILARAERNGIEEPWTRMVRSKLRWYRIRKRFLGS